MFIHSNEFYPSTVAVVCFFFIDLFVNYLCCIECTRDEAVLHNIIQTFLCYYYYYLFSFSCTVRPELYTPQLVICMITCTGKLVLGTVTIKFR